MFSILLRYEKCLTTEIRFKMSNNQFGKRRVEGNYQTDRVWQVRNIEKDKRMNTDPIADMLTRIRNANMVSHETVEIPASKLKVELAKLLKSEGYITDYAEIGRAHV